MSDPTITAGDPRYDGFRISHVWAFTVVDPKDDQEGIPAFRSEGVMVPLVASDGVRLESLRGMAQHMADSMGLELKLRKFTGGEVVETIRPRS